MAEFIDKERAKKRLISDYAYAAARILDELPAADVVSNVVLEQVMWERDAAIAQLNSYGVGLAEKADAVRVKHGRWVEKDNNYDTYYDCSVCGESFVFIDGSPIDNLYSYCPNCGAKMDEKETE